MKRALPLTLLLFFSAATAHAQTIRGTLVDDVSDGPVVSGAVVLTDRNGVVRGIARSDADGRFTLKSEPGDTVRVRVEREGYATLESKPWVLGRNAVLELTLRLKPIPLTLDTLTVTGAWRSRNRQTYDRRRRGEIEGSFADGEKLERIHFARTSDLLRALFPRILPTPDGRIMVRKRGVDISGNASCQPRYYIDGMRYPGDLSLDALVTGPQIRAVEFYPDALFAPPTLSAGNDRMIVNNKMTLSKPCAIIVIWTDMGFGESS
jgi:hypothetical protein